jgi:hypothetical protein
MQVSITEVVPGDILVEGRTRIKVDKIEHRACSSRGSHVNGKYCYNRTDVVEVIKSKRKVRTIEAVEILEISLEPNGMGEILEVR